MKVDGKAYSFLGAPAVSGATFTKATQKSFKVGYGHLVYGMVFYAFFQFTATQSVFVLSAGPVDLTVTFLSPVEARYIAITMSQIILTKICAFSRRTLFNSQSHYLTWPSLRPLLMAHHIQYKFIVTSAESGPQEIVV